MNTENKLKIDDFTKALAECINQAQGNVVDPMVLAETWKGELIKLAKSEESVSEDLEEEIDNYVKRNGYDGLDSIEEVKYIANHFVKWQKEQMEKYRIEHCNSITNEQAELEQGFIDQHLDKHQRMPTFLDAIEYGMRLQKEQMMAKAINTEASFNMSVPCICISLPLGVKVGDKVKVIVTKEG